jgi:hypothetical protein
MPFSEFKLDFKKNHSHTHTVSMVYSTKCHFKIWKKYRDTLGNLYEETGKKVIPPILEKQELHFSDTKLDKFETIKAWP